MEYNIRLKIPELLSSQMVAESWSWEIDWCWEPQRVAYPSKNLVGAMAELGRYPGEGWALATELRRRRKGRRQAMLTSCLFEGRVWITEVYIEVRRRRKGRREPMLPQYCCRQFNAFV